MLRNKFISLSLILEVIYLSQILSESLWNEIDCENNKNILCAIYCRHTSTNLDTTIKGWFSFVVFHWQ